jgi:hypothetical protein
MKMSTNRSDLIRVNGRMCTKNSTYDVLNTYLIKQGWERTSEGGGFVWFGEKKLPRELTNILIKAGFTYVIEKGHWVECP